MAAEVYPALSGCGLAERWAGLEAFTPDDLPVLGPVPGVDGLFVAVGDVLARLALGRDALEHLWRDLRFDRPALAGA